MVIVSISIVSAYIVGMLVFSILRRKRMNTDTYYYGKACRFGWDYIRMIKKTAKEQNWSDKKLQNELHKFNRAVNWVKKHMSDEPSPISG